MKFQSEVHLVEVLKCALRSIFNRDNYQIFEQVSLGYGVADIVISDIDLSIILGMSESEFLNRFDVNLYNLINKNFEVEFDDICDTIRCSKNAVSNSIYKLINRNLIFQNGSKFIIANEYQLPFKNNFAIEAKIKDWKRALGQARRYKWFAEYSYVVLDEHFSKSAKENINLFYKSNVGLATISTDGELKRIFSPIRQKPYDPIMPILFSEQILLHHR
jgi:hypothetical protein